MIADLLITNARWLVTCAGPAPRRGRGQSDAGCIEHGDVAARDGIIIFAGRTVDRAACVDTSSQTRVVDATHRSILPGFVDPHTHVVFAGDRRDEL